MTTDTPFAKSTPRKAAPAKREAGGDNEVERDGNGRPRIIVACVTCMGTGKVPSEKRPGKLNKCLKCSGEGKKKVSYTRVTTFIDVLEDKEILMHWKARMVLVGVALDGGFLKDVAAMNPEDPEDRKALDRRTEAAAELAGASKKADKGTELHALSEMADEHEELPLDITPEDWLDIHSYVQVTHPLLKIVRMEQLVVNDEYKVAGTPDRVSSPLPGVTLTAPNGYVFRVDELIITDLKTGRVDYGQLKMAMQLAIYSRSDVYDKESGGRIDKGPVNQDWGLIMHTAAGSGHTTLYWVDLQLGWRAVEVASMVREMRRQNRKALVPFATTDESLVQSTRDGVETASAA